MGNLYTRIRYGKNVKVVYISPTNCKKGEHDYFIDEIIIGNPIRTIYRCDWCDKKYESTDDRYLQDSYLLHLKPDECKHHFKARKISFRFYEHLCIKCGEGWFKGLGG